MNSKKTIVITILSLLICASLSNGAPKSTNVLESTPLKINRSKIDAPLIEKNGTVMFSIRDCLDALGATLTYDRKENLYKLTSEKTKKTLAFCPYSRELKYDKTLYQLAIAPTFYDNHLYVPLEDFCNLLSYDIQKTKNEVILTHESGKRIIPKPKKTQTQPEIKEPKIETKQPEKEVTQTDYTPVTLAEIQTPPQKKGQEIFLAFGDNIYDISDFYLYKKNIFYVNLKAILENNGFTVTETDREIIIKNNQQSFTIDLLKQTEYSPVIQNNTYYYPFKSLLLLLNLGSKWEAKPKRLTVINRIQKVILTKSDATPVIQLHASLPISPDEVDIEKENSIYKVILPTLKTTFKKPLTSQSSSIQSIAFKTEDVTTTLTLTTKEQIPHPFIETRPYGAEITFRNDIQTLKETLENGKRIITIEGTSPLTYSIQTFKNPNRLIIDIPNSVSKLPLIIQTQAKAYQKIRTSLFKKSPPHTRIVIDLNKDSNLHSDKAFDNKLQLIFQEQSKEAEPVKHRKRLNKKIIIVDAGHGGSDPGALGIDRSYEKKYTLEIANMLKNYLENEGAFVVMTREEDQNISLQKRPQIANINKGDLFISIHLNSFFNNIVNGTETYYYKPKDKKLAKILHEEMIKTLGRRDNGIKNGRLYVLTHTEMPAALVEPLYITYPEEHRLIIKTEFKDKIAKSLLNGIIQYFKETD